MKSCFVLILLLIQVALADDCGPMNLVTEPSSPFQKIPVYDQDGANICYAYVASQLVDYHQIKNNKNRSVHPLWAALKYAESKNYDSVELGATHEALKELAARGNCHSDKISNALGLWAKKANIGEPEVISLIEILAPKLQALHEKKKNEGTSAPTISQNEMDSIIQEAIELHKPHCSPNATLDQLLPELRSLSVMSSRKLLASLILPDCSSDLQKLTFPSPQKIPISSYGDDGWSLAIQKKLHALKAPIAISYCANVLSDPTYDGIKNRSAKTISEKYAKDCGRHTSLIVGKKKIGNKCHLLLRNTWGTGFGKSTRKWNCLCKNKTTGEMVDECNIALHNNGRFTVEGCWIDAEALGKNIYRMTYLEDTVLRER